MMLGLILLVSIGPGFYVLWRVAGEQAWRSLERNLRAYPSLNRGKTEPSFENYLAGTAIGIAAFFVWPWFVLLWIGGRNRAGLRRLVYVPPEYRRVFYERRIKELEREVGIGA